jgi:hypothetical protein
MFGDSDSSVYPHATRDRWFPESGRKCRPELDSAYRLKMATRHFRLSTLSSLQSYASDTGRLFGLEILTAATNQKVPLVLIFLIFVCTTGWPRSLFDLYVPHPVGGDVFNNSGLSSFPRVSQAVSTLLSIPVYMFSKLLLLRLVARYVYGQTQTRAGTERADICLSDSSAW